MDWGASMAAYTVMRSAEAPERSVERYQNPGNRDYVEIVTDEVAYERRFANYADFHQRATGREYSLHAARQFEVVASRDESVVVVGLNSARHLDHYFTKRARIDPDALSGALGALGLPAGAPAKPPHVVFVWHHPVVGPESLDDSSFMQQLAV